MNEKMTILITGGASGVGCKLTEAFLSYGHEVFCASRFEVKNSELSNNDNFYSFKLDVTNKDDCELAVKECINKFGKIDLLLNNASSNLGGIPIGGYSHDEIFNEINVTLIGSLYMTNAFVKYATKPELRQRVFFMSSSSGYKGEKGNEEYPIYAAGKAGLIRFSETIQDTLRCNNTSSHVLIPDGIRFENFIEEQSVSAKDIFESIMFICKKSDNLHIDQLRIKPFLI